MSVLVCRYDERTGRFRRIRESVFRHYLESSRGNVLPRGGRRDWYTVSPHCPLVHLTPTLTHVHLLRLNTAFQALFGSRALKLAQPFGPNPQGEGWIFIYGGSTSVALYAIQLAKLSGYKIATVASTRNHELLKNYGADAVFDVRILLSFALQQLTHAFLQYRDPDMIQKVKAATGDKIHIALDTISEKETQFTTIKALAEDVPGKLLVILPQVEGLSDVRKDVEIGCSSTFPYPSSITKFQR